MGEGAANTTKSVVFFTIFFVPNKSERLTAFRFLKFSSDSNGNFGFITELQYLLLDTKLDLPGHARHEEDPGHRLPANVSITLLFLLHI